MIHHRLSLLVTFTLALTACTNEIEGSKRSPWGRAQEALPRSVEVPAEQADDVPRHVQLSTRLELLGPAKQQARAQLLDTVAAQLGQRLGGEVGVSHQLGDLEQLTMKLKTSAACVQCVSLELGFGSTYTFDLPIYSGSKQSETEMVLVAPLGFAQRDDQLIVYLDLENVGELGLAKVTTKFDSLPDSVKDQVDAKIQEYWQTYLAAQVPRIHLGTLVLPALGGDVRYTPSEVALDPAEQVLHLTLGTNLPGVVGEIPKNELAWRPEDSVTMSIHPGVLVSATRMAMGRGELATRYDERGAPSEMGRFGVMPTGAQGTAQDVTFKVDLFDFTAEDPEAVPRQILLKTRSSKLEATWVERQATDGDGPDQLLDAWLARHNTWVNVAGLDTSYVNVGLLHTRARASSLSWHAGAKLEL